jgi:hypothetical protein
MSMAATAAASIRAMASSRARSDAFSPSRAVELVIVVSLFFWPRLFILGFVIFSRQIGEAFSSWVIWFAGFFILPWTTITYAMMWGIYSDRVFGVEWVFVGLAFLLDLVTWSTLRDR